MIIYNIVQVNLNHCWGAHDMLQQFMKSRNIYIAMITEPVYIPDTWASSNDKKAAIFWVKDLKVRVKTVFKGEEFIAVEINDLILISCYISPKLKLVEFSEVLDRLKQRMQILGKQQIILCGDFNAHSKAWGSAFTGCKGSILEKWMEANNLILINVGEKPTCVRSQGNSIVDLT